MRRLSPLNTPVTIDFEGEQLEAEAGEPLACTVMQSGVMLFSRSVKYHRPRGPFCMTGGCSNCLMRVDGQPNIATCMTPARAGMRLERQNSFPDATVDVFAANDLVFRKWFNHHEFMAGVPIVEQVMLKIARKLAGSGQLPDETLPPMPPAKTESIDLLVVGGGAAGLGAARRLTEKGVKFTLLERDPDLGGRLTASAEEGMGAAFRPKPESVRLSAPALGLFADDGRQFVASTYQGRLYLTYFKRILLAVGGQSTLLPFENNDLHGIVSGRAVARMIKRHAMLPGPRVACLGDIDEARALAKLVTEMGGEALAVGGEPLRAHGMQRVAGVTAFTGVGTAARVDCDVIAVCAPVSPSFEMARAGGAKIDWDVRHKVFVVDADRSGRTASPTVFVCGELRGPMSAAAAAESGLAAAEAVSASLEGAK